MITPSVTTIAFTAGEVVALIDVIRAFDSDASASQRNAITCDLDVLLEKIQTARPNVAASVGNNQVPGRELVEALADNKRLRELCELQSRTLERALRRMRGHSIIADAITSAQPTADETEKA
jgi:CCR4-NOT transcriptional regulation complex NOT5 subunit